MLSASWNMLHYTTAQTQLCTEVAVIVPIMNRVKIVIYYVGQSDWSSFAT